MRVLVLTNENLKEELLSTTFHKDLAISWFYEGMPIGLIAGHDAIIDLLFDNSQTKLEWLRNIPGSLIIVNSVLTSLTELDPNFIRINGWNTFLQRSAIEASGLNSVKMQKADELFELMGRKIEWVPDLPGFVTSRVISSLINEAYLSLEEGVSSEEEIDMALKLGTNYPYGPFEWAKKIGLQNIYGLLNRLSMEQVRYTPSTLLQQKALA